MATGKFLRFALSCAVLLIVLLVPAGDATADLVHLTGLEVREGYGPFIGLMENPFAKADGTLRVRYLGANGTGWIFFNARRDWLQGKHLVYRYSSTAFSDASMGDFLIRNGEWHSDFDSIPFDWTALDFQTIAGPISLRGTGGHPSEDGTGPLNFGPGTDDVVSLWWEIRAPTLFSGSFWLHQISILSSTLDVLTTYDLTSWTESLVVEGGEPLWIQEYGHYGTPGGIVGPVFVPEPAGLLSVGLGLALLAWFGRRRSARSRRADDDPSSRVGAAAELQLQPSRRPACAGRR